MAAVVRPGGDDWRLDGLDVERLELDLREEGAAASALAGAPEWLFHLAAHGAYSWQTDARAIVETSLTTTVRLLEAAAAQGLEAFVHTGSSSEYGAKDYAPDEEEALEPNSVYGAAKAAATLYCRSAARERDAHVVTLRLYSVYGPYEEPRRFVPTLLVHALDGTLPPLVAPETARDFVYVDDVCEALVAAAGASTLPRGTILNIGSGRQTTIGDIVAVARRLFALEVEPEWGTYEPRAWDTSSWVANPARARELLGWQARTTLDEGLAATGDWLQASPLLERVYRPGIRG